jgi:hypothetical protein
LHESLAQDPEVLKQLLLFRPQCSLMQAACGWCWRPHTDSTSGAATQVLLTHQVIYHILCSSLRLYTNKLDSQQLLL